MTISGRDVVFGILCGLIILSALVATRMAWDRHDSPSLLPIPDRMPLIEHQANGCYRITPPPTSGAGQGGSATICGEGSCAQAGANGGHTEPNPTYCLRNGTLEVHRGEAYPLR